MSAYPALPRGESIWSDLVRFSSDMDLKRKVMSAEGNLDNISVELSATSGRHCIALS